MNNDNLVLEWELRHNKAAGKVILVGSNTKSQIGALRALGNAGAVEIMHRLLNASLGEDEGLAVMRDWLEASNEDDDFDLADQINGLTWDNSTVLEVEFTNNGEVSTQFIRIETPTGALAEAVGLINLATQPDGIAYAVECSAMGLLTGLMETLGGGEQEDGR